VLLHSPSLAEETATPETADSVASVALQKKQKQIENRTEK